MSRRVRRQLGVVLQNSRVMSASVFENISSNALITMDEAGKPHAWQAVQNIAAMPMGMHTVVSEGGTNLSRWTRFSVIDCPRSGIASRILLFDEATGALNNRTKRGCQ